MIEILKDQIRVSHFLWNPKDQWYQNPRKKQEFLSNTAVLLNQKYPQQAPRFTARDVQVRCAQMKIRRRRFIPEQSGNAPSIAEQNEVSTGIEDQSNFAHIEGHSEIIVPEHVQPEPEIKHEEEDRVFPEQFDTTINNDTSNPQITMQDSNDPYVISLLKNVLQKQSKVVDHFINSNEDVFSHSRFCRYLSSSMDDLDDDLADRVITVTMGELMKVREEQRKRGAIKNDRKTTVSSSERQETKEPLPHSIIEYSSRDSIAVHIKQEEEIDIE